MPTERLSFAGHDGSTLAAKLDMPTDALKGTAVFAHCFSCTKDSLATRRISKQLAANGIAVLRFDFTGLGHSEGDFSTTDYSSNVEDIILAARYLLELNMPPSLLIGHSFGGAAALKAAADIPSLKAVVTLGTPAQPSHVTHNFEDHLDEIRSKGSADVTLGGRPFKIVKAFLDDVESIDLTPVVANLKKALLVMHAPGDQTVGVSNAADIFGAAKHPKSFVTLDDANHLITRAQDADYAADVIVAWSKRYLDAPTVDGQTPDAPEGVLRVSEADPTGFLQNVTEGQKHIFADEPRSMGGSDKGLTPYGLLSAGLGACTSMTLRMYARRKGLPMTHVAVDVRHEKRKDANGVEQSHFLRTIHLQGNLDADQKAKLLMIADKCPVHKTLTKASKVETILGAS
ncbi:MAG: bifunctional alpha/beta hydrolase/OsmC family protein [Planktomarina sp.]